MPRGAAWGAEFSVHAISLGSSDPQAPAVGFFGGVHGLERIGAQVVIAFLQSVLHRLPWDCTLQYLLERVRLVFMPIVNPGGMWAATRANPRGIDLMRNAPVDARDRVPFLVGGQRLSSGLPWYRGRLGDPMETESQALCSLVQTELLGRPFSLALDCHSGFGVTDRLWFPYAHTREPMAHLAEVHALQHIFLQAHSQHPYVIEPQSAQYLAHGDLWDHLYLQARHQGGTVFLPLTLEMGSWLWIKKNPQQLFAQRHLQPTHHPPPPARAASPPGPAGLSDPRRRQPQPVAAPGRGAPTPPPPCPGHLVLTPGPAPGCCCAA